MLPEDVDIEQSGSLVTLHLTRREVTPSQMQEIVDECAERMRYSGARHFIFDLQGVEFLASACLGVLVSLMQDVEHFRGRLAVANCHDNVAFLFKVTRLDRVFGLYDDPADAAAAM